MTDEIGRVSSVPELAHRLGIPVEKLKLYTDANRNVLSLRINSPEDKRTIRDKIESDNPTPQDNVEVDNDRIYYR